MSKPILCLDFDGVIHSYTSGWQGEAVVADPPVPGAMKFIDDAMDWFTVHIYSSRSQSGDGRNAMKDFVRTHMKAYAEAELGRDDGGRYADDVIEEITFPHSKPAAFLSIDDRALQFNGYWPDPEKLLQFNPWNKRSGTPPVEQHNPFAVLVAECVGDQDLLHWTEQVVIGIRNMRDANGNRVCPGLPVPEIMSLARAVADQFARRPSPLPFHTRTNDGRAVRIVAIDAKRDRPLIGLVTEADGKEAVGEWYVDGSWWSLPDTASAGIRREAARMDLAEVPKT